MPGEPVWFTLKHTTKANSHLQNRVILLSGASISGLAVPPMLWGQKDLPLECTTQSYTVSDYLNLWLLTTLLIHNVKKPLSSSGLESLKILGTRLNTESTLNLSISAGRASFLTESYQAESCLIDCIKYDHKIMNLLNKCIRTCNPNVGLPWWHSGKRICLQYRRLMFDPWVGKIPWRRKWQCTPVFLPEKFQAQRSLAGYSPGGHESQLQLTN